MLKARRWYWVDGPLSTLSVRESSGEQAHADSTAAASVEVLPVDRKVENELPWTEAGVSTGHAKPGDRELRLLVRDLRWAIGSRQVFCFPNSEL